jgi:hypothetical protein
MAEKAANPTCPFPRYPFDGRRQQSMGEAPDAADKIEGCIKEINGVNIQRLGIGSWKESTGATGVGIFRR